MYHKFEADYGKEIRKFHNGLGGVLWSVEDVCKYLQIEDPDKAVKELDPEVKDETLVLPDDDSQAKKLPRKVAIIDYRGLFSLLFRSQAPIAKKFQSFVNDQFFFEMFLHWSPYFLENKDADTNADYESLMEDLKVELGVWG